MLSNSWIAILFALCIMNQTLFNSKDNKEFSE